MHTIGSVGQADLSQMAEIGLALTGQTISVDELRAAGLEPLELGPREAHAILNANAYAVGAACLALRRARRALDGLELAAALSYEAVLGNVDALHPAIGRARPYPGDQRARDRIAGAARRRRARARAGRRHATCRTRSASRDWLRHMAPPTTRSLISIISCRSSSGRQATARSCSPRRTVRSRPAATRSPRSRSRSTMRGWRSPAPVTIGCERIQKLLDPRFTDLPTGLRSRPDSAQDGLAIVGHGAASLAAEARLLAAPVTLEQPTSSIAAGIEDRVTMAPVAACGCTR